MTYGAGSEHVDDEGGAGHGCIGDDEHCVELEMATALDVIHCEMRRLKGYLTSAYLVELVVMSLNCPS